MIIRSILFAAIGACSVATSNAAAAENRFHFDGRVGSAEGGETTAQAMLGYRWTWFGIEGGYGSLGDVLGTRADIDAWFVGATAKKHFGTTPWYFGARLGVSSWDARRTRFSAATGGQSLELIEENTDGVDPYFGVSIGYDFNDRWSLGASFDRFDLDESVGSGLNVFSVGTEIRF